MRDVVRDAAIVMMARAYEEADTPAVTFLDLYEDRGSRLYEYVADLLCELKIIKQIWKEIPWWDRGYSDDKRGEYVWVWSAEA